ncbi:MAG: hypothetical protein RIQ79_735 [Verrucomicrobiota bacterium]
MLKLSILVVSTVLSFAVGYGADALGADFFWSFLLSGVGAVAGCWLGWWLHRRFLD